MGEHSNNVLFCNFNFFTGHFKSTFYFLSLGQYKENK